MATNGIDPSVKRLDGLIKITGYSFGQGGYADIYPGLWIDSGVAVAIKVFRGAHLKTQTPADRQKYWKCLNKEYRVWALLDHPNVLRLDGLIDCPEMIPSFGIVAPRCSLGDLNNFFLNPARATIGNRLSIIKGIATGLTYVHEENVVHGDLTMNNVLVEVVDGKFTPLLSDFGRARVLEQAGYTSSASKAVHRHTPPEIMTIDDDDRTTKTFTQAGDVWCFGMLMLEALTGKVPFWYKSELQTITAVAYGNEKPDQSRYPTFLHDNSCWEIMGRCWHREPSDREKMPPLLASLNALSNAT